EKHDEQDRHEQHGLEHYRAGIAAGDGSAHGVACCGRRVSWGLSAEPLTLRDRPGTTLATVARTSTCTRSPLSLTLTVTSRTRPRPAASSTLLAVAVAVSGLASAAVAANAASCAAAVTTWRAWYASANCTTVMMLSSRTGRIRTSIVVAVPRSGSRSPVGGCT